MLSPTPGWVLDAPFCLVALLLSPPGPVERSADPADPAPHVTAPRHAEIVLPPAASVCAPRPACPSSAAAHSWPGSAPHPPPATRARSPPTDPPANDSCPSPPCRAATAPAALDRNVLRRPRPAPTSAAPSLLGVQPYHLLPAGMEITS